MKGYKLLFAVCLGFIAFNDAMADDATSTARAATRRGTGNTVTSSSAGRQKAPQNTTGETLSGGTTTSRATTSAIKPTTTATPRDRNVGTRNRTVIYDSARNQSAPASVSARTTSSIPRTVQSGTSNVSRNTTIIPNRTTSAVSRSTKPSATTVSRNATQVRGTTSQTTRDRSATNIKNISRAAATTTELRESIMNKDYKTCRQVYYDCMDEFCANKDSQLKRCACSTRIHEFDRVKKQLSNIEDKMLDFNQRLLTVNMDKEDAAALFTATEGELAFNKKDTSDSKKILDEISKKLNTNTNDSFNQNLSSISLSLNADAAFDNVDSLMGAATTSKEGIDLYNAALPVCREMAAEVCDDQSLAIAESGYQMTIEQDCNTVAKTYETQTDQAREKIREGGALLDISRLDIYQKRNSDDILTCKKKMLAQLSNTSVCGDNLDKCLDMSGRYIDPSTGEAFLTVDLANLGNLITRPTDGQSWTAAPGNEKFVSYLYSKKKYIEPAMENCQEIADSVWDMFIEDALAQIKLAQDNKLEEVRQSCTTLTTQCLTTTSKSLSDFDARALSTFGVAADKTVNDMCNSVKQACTALLKTTSTTTEEDWIGGMTGIATDKTYATIVQTCREVGRACIIQACKSVSGNFGMCENIQTSINRKSIINRTACWNEVKNCVASAGEDAINQIFNQTPTDQFSSYNIGGTFYKELYGIEPNDWRFTNNLNITPHCYNEKGTNTCIFDACSDECNCPAYKTDNEGNVISTSYIGENEKLVANCGAATSMACRVCRLSEKIWGNCEASPTVDVTAENSHNRILIPTNTDTLLSWFAKNTGTANSVDSCRDTTCPSGYYPDPNGSGVTICLNSADKTNGDGQNCPIANGVKINITSDVQNCCPTSTASIINNNICCLQSSNKIISSTSRPFYSNTTIKNVSSCINANNAKIVAQFKTDKFSGTEETVSLVCLSDNNLQGKNIEPNYPSGQRIECDGKFIYITEKGMHIDPKKENDTTLQQYMSFSIDNGGYTCVYNSNTYAWEPTTELPTGTQNPCPTNPTAWSVTPPSAPNN